MKIRNKYSYVRRVLPGAAWRALRSPARGPVHLIVALADHFEPAIDPTDGRKRVPRDEQERRLEEWRREYPKAVDRWRDHDERPFVHTYFYPAEQYDAGLMEILADHAHAGYGEVEVHLHHGIPVADTAENTRTLLTEFRDHLAFRHRCLSIEDGSSQPRYAFVHGNFALANSANGYGCGVDSEMRILAETGCYADLTLPTGVGHIAQTRKINSIYECSLPLDRRAPHRLGKDLAVGRQLGIVPLMIQGPTLVDVRQSVRSRHLVFECGAVAGSTPMSLQRLKLWKHANIVVKGRPDWVFIKLHCHGMDPTQKEVVLGDGFKNFLEMFVTGAAERQETLHFVTAREMTNILFAACDGKDGSPGHYRDYRLRKIADLPISKTQYTSTPVGARG